MSLSYSTLTVPTLNVPSMPPPEQLGYHSNNVYENFPPMMADGRVIIASYQPDAIANEQIIKDNNIKTNWEYRKYLQENAKEIMRQNCLNMSNDVGYVRRYEIEPVKATPFIFKKWNERASEKVQGYPDSDLKRMYLTREELNSRVTTDTPITQEDIIRYR